MKILAIDPGTKLGWASNVSGRLEWGEQDLSLKRGESPGMRFHNFNEWLGKMGGREEMSMYAFLIGGDGKSIPWKEGPFFTAPELIVYELPHLRGGAATDVLVGMTTRIVEFCAVWSKCREINHVAVHSATLKKFATGKGRGDKKAMTVAALRRLTAEGQIEHGLPVASMATELLSDNQADALWLYWWAKQHYGGNDGQR